MHCLLCALTAWCTCDEHLHETPRNLAHVGRSSMRRCSRACTCKPACRLCTQHTAHSVPKATLVYMPLSFDFVVWMRLLPCARMLQQAVGDLLCCKALAVECQEVCLWVQKVLRTDSQDEQSAH